MKKSLQNEFLKIDVASLGGALSSIQDKDGLEYLWQGDKQYWSGQAPVLFPICGSLRNNQAVIGGDRKTTMPRHGIVRKKEFALEKADDKEIVYSIEANEELLAQYPYDFKLSISYKLLDKSIVITYNVENRSEEAMPCFLGAHPAFNCPLTADTAYEDYYVEFEQEESCTSATPLPDSGLVDRKARLPFLANSKRLPLDYKYFAVEAIVLDELKSRKVTLKTDKHSKGIEMDFSDFKNLLLWSTANKGPFIALEPWSGLSTCTDESDVFEEKANVSLLPPQSSKKWRLVISIL